jgi:DNA mismatch endonuclease (patch repair protein)
MSDHLTPEQRFRAMSRVKRKDGALEVAVRSQLHKRGYRFRKHVKSLPGSPDLVLPRNKIAVFIDGDFWHGYRLPLWEHKLSDFWREKLWRNRRRDQKNFRKLRRSGWRVIRLWQHEIRTDASRCVDRIVEAVIERTTPRETEVRE